MKKIRRKRGFTLIELIAVLVIMAILALIVTPLVMSIIRKAKISARKRSVDAYGRSVELAIASYLLDKGAFPTNEQLPNLQVEYNGSTVVCNVMSIKENGGLYLSECKVNNIDVKDSSTEDGWYHYGSIVNPPSAANDLLAKANPSTVTSYTDGNTTEMYTFEHPATEQTGALTDYRYIGANPNNYVTFNNELWRIIGVFTVEDANGNTEQRIKIIRNEKLPSSMPWDSNNVNEWSTASLNTYLNGDYYNGLNTTSKSMIADTKYYLGGSKTNAGGAEAYYTWEHGTSVYSGNGTNWTGKIALMYPSDYLYTYALGVDNACYTDGSYYGCGSSQEKTNGWIYNFNNDSIEWILFASSEALSAYNSYLISGFGSGMVGNDTLTHEYGIRPTTYLNSQVKIDSGDGSEQSPYQLSL